MRKKSVDDRLMAWMEEKIDGGEMMKRRALKAERRGEVAKRRSGMVVRGIGMKKRVRTTG